MDDHLIADIARVAIAADAMLLCLLIARLGWERYIEHDPDPETDRPHWATYASFAIALFSIAVYRFTSIGDPIDSRFWVSLAIVTLGTYGVLKRVRLGIRGLTDRR
jgi:hypothetical protein